MVKTKGERARALTALGFVFFIDNAEDVALPMLFPAIRTSLGLNYSASMELDTLFSRPSKVRRRLHLLHP